VQQSGGPIPAYNSNGLGLLPPDAAADEAEAPLADNSPFRQSWQKPYQPNMTGTDRAYLPPGHTLEGGKRGKATGDYEAWRPD